jgi:hypothetical protein
MQSDSSCTQLFSVHETLEEINFSFRFLAVQAHIFLTKNGNLIFVLREKWHNRAPASVKYTIAHEDGRVRPKHTDE